LKRVESFSLSVDLISLIVSFGLYFLINRKTKEEEEEGADEASNKVNVNEINQRERERPLAGVWRRKKKLKEELF
jgi:hypothetical protein